MCAVTEASTEEEEVAQSAQLGDQGRLHGGGGLGVEAGDMLE
jgi:hypothetical protein